MVAEGVLAACVVIFTRTSQSTFKRNEEGCKLNRWAGKAARQANIFQWEMSRWDRPQTVFYPVRLFVIGPKDEHRRPKRRFP
jgi:hypothetical protein